MNCSEKPISYIICMFWVKMKEKLRTKLKCLCESEKLKHKMKPHFMFIECYNINRRYVGGYLSFILHTNEGEEIYLSIDWKISTVSNSLNQYLVLVCFNVLIREKLPFNIYDRLANVNYVFVVCTQHTINSQISKPKRIEPHNAFNYERMPSWIKAMKHKCMHVYARIYIDIKLYTLHLNINEWRSNVCTAKIKWSNNLR